MTKLEEQLLKAAEIGKSAPFHALADVVAFKEINNRVLGLDKDNNAILIYDGTMDALCKQLGIKND